MSNRIKTTLGFTIAGLLIFVGMVSSNISTSKFIDDTDWTIHSLEVRRQTEKLATLFMAAQNNIRGYHMTEQEYYMDLHDQAKAELLSTLDKLRELTRDNQVQQKNLENLSNAFQEKIRLWQSSLDIRRTQGFAAIQKSMQSLGSKNQDQAVLESVQALRTEEDRLLSERMEATRTQGKNVKFYVWLGGMLACLLITTATYLVYRDSRRRELAEANVERFFTLSLDLLCISGMDGYFKSLSPSHRLELHGYS